MNLRDAETGKVLWQGTDDLSVPGVEHEGMFTQTENYNHTIQNTVCVPNQWVTIVVECVSL